MASDLHQSRQSIDREEDGCRSAGGIESDGKDGIGIGMGEAANPIVVLGIPGCGKSSLINALLSNSLCSGPFKPSEGEVKSSVFQYQCSKDSTSRQLNEVFESALRRAKQRTDLEDSRRRRLVFVDEAGLRKETVESLKAIHSSIDDGSPLANKSYDFSATLAEAEAEDAGSELQHEAAGNSHMAVTKVKIHGQDLSFIDTPGLCDSNQHKVLDNLLAKISDENRLIVVLVMAVADADAFVDVGAKVVETLIDRVGKLTHVILCGTKVDLAKEDEQKRFMHDIDGPSIKSRFFSKLPEQPGTCVMVGKDDCSKLLEAIQNLLARHNVTEDKHHRRRSPRSTYPKAFHKTMDAMYMFIEQIKESILIADELPRWLIKQLVLEEYSASSKISPENLLEELRETIAKTARDLFNSKSGSDQVKCTEVGSFINEVLERLKRLPKIVPALKKIPADLIQSSKIHVCNSKGPELLNHMVKLVCQPRADLLQESSPIHYAQQLGQRAERAFEDFADTCFRAADIMPESIKNLTEAKADINFADGLQRTALHDHAVALHLETVKSLIYHNASVDKEDSEGNTPFALAQKAGACEELMMALDYVVLLMLSGQTLVVRRLLFLEEHDFVSFIRDYVQQYYMKERHERVSYFAIGITLDGHGVAETNKSWEALGSPREMHVTVGHNSRNDPEKSKDFLRSAERIGSETDLLIQGHLENFQDPDVGDERGETAAWKAARYDDLSKLKILDMACAKFDKQDELGASPLFIASQYGNQTAVEFLVQHRAEVDLSLKTNASPLYVACQNGHKDTAAFLLMSGAEPDKQTDDFATPTFIAAQMGEFEIVKMMLEAKADKNMANVTDASPLFIAAQNDHKEIVEYLLERQACIDQRTKSGASPTYIAAQKGCMQALQLLLDARADANLQANDGATSILIAAQNDKKDAVQLLLKYGACIRKGMKSGATPLFVAAQNGYLEVVKGLVEADDLEGSDQKLVNICLNNGTSAFYVAAQNGHLAVVECLHEKKADMNLKSSGNASAFFIAAQNGHLDVCLFLFKQERQRLREKQECQLIERTEDGSGPLLVAAQNGHLEIVKALTKELQEHFSPERMLEAGNRLHTVELINEAKKGGATALYLASQNGHPGVVSYLIDSRASVHKELDTEETPMFIASQGGHDAVAQILLEAQADVNKGKKDKTSPLYIASQNGHTSLVKLLLDANASVNAQNDSMATALFISSQKGYGDIVSTLLSRNADYSLKIKSHAQPLYIAAMKGHVKVVTMLMEAHADVNATPLHKTTPLQIAIRNGFTDPTEVADRLLDAGANVNQADQFDKTCLDEAMKKDDQPLVQKLITLGAEREKRIILNEGVRLLRPLPEKVVSIVRNEVMQSAVSGYPSGHKFAGDEDVTEMIGGLELLRKALEHGRTLVSRLGAACARLQELMDRMAGEVLLNEQFLDSLSEVQKISSECGRLAQQMHDDAGSSSLKLSALFLPLFSFVRKTTQECSENLSDLSANLTETTDLSHMQNLRNKLFTNWHILTDTSSLTKVSNSLFDTVVLLLKKSTKEISKKFTDDNWKSEAETLQQGIMEKISKEAFILFKSEPEASEA